MASTAAARRGLSSRRSTGPRPTERSARSRSLAPAGRRPIGARLWSRRRGPGQGRERHTTPVRLRTHGRFGGVVRRHGPDPRAKPARASATYRSATTPRTRRQHPHRPRHPRRPADTDPATDTDPAAHTDPDRLRHPTGVTPTPTGPAESEESSVRRRPARPRIPTLPSTSTLDGQGTDPTGDGWRIILLVVAGLLAVALLLTPAGAVVRKDDRSR